GDQRQRDGALPAERAADLNGGGEDFRIEQPRRRVRPRRAFQNGALGRAAAAARASRAKVARPRARRRANRQIIRPTMAITTKIAAIARPAWTLPICGPSRSEAATRGKTKRGNAANGT